MSKTLIVVLCTPMCYQRIVITGYTAKLHVTSLLLTQSSGISGTDNKFLSIRDGGSDNCNDYIITKGAPYFIFKKVLR